MIDDTQVKADFRAKQLEWARTHIGKLFYRFENAIGRAWVTDATSHSDTAMTRDWNVADKARAEFLQAIRGW